MVGQRNRSMAVVVVGVLAALGASVAVASVPDGTGVIHGCYGESGRLRVVEIGRDRACKRRETPLEWNARGPKGDKGETGATGTKGDAGPPGRQGDPGYRVDDAGNRVYDNPTGDHLFNAAVHAPSVVARAIELPEQSLGVRALSAPPGFAGRSLTATDAGAVVLTDPIADLGLSREGGALHLQAPNGVDLNGACTAVLDLVCANEVHAARLTAPAATIGGCTVATGAATCTGAITGSTLKSGGCTFGSATGGAACSGPFFINGTLQVTGGKLFMIDHPLDPKRKLLSHAAVESPALTNLYNGNVVTDRHGFAVVRLPRYFEALNRDFRYQLTVVGRSFAQAIVWQEIEKNRFTIKTSQSHVKVSWQVTGVRHDRYALEHPLHVEQAKPAGLRGRTFYR